MLGTCFLGNAFKSAIASESPQKIVHTFLVYRNCPLLTRQRTVMNYSDQSEALNYVKLDL